MVRVLRIFLLLNPWNRNRLRTVLEEIVFGDETQVMVDSSSRVYVWRRPDEVWRPECIRFRGNCKFSAMIWDCITYQGVEW
jgi:hypothetical protein